MVIKEWIEHYIKHGIEHFYLINDNSNDNFMEILQPYINLNIVTLFQNDTEKIRGRQGIAYDKYFKSILKDTYWLAIFDIDEYCYSPNEINITNILKNYEQYSQIEINWVWFGSNNFTKQPDNIVKSFTKRAEYGKKVYASTPFGNEYCGTDGPKVILNTKFKINNIGIHNSYIDGDKINLSWKENPINPLLLINHYSIMSLEYWTKIKMTRGDVNNWHSDNARNIS
jgi:hypothetical protein